MLGFERLGGGLARLRIGDLIDLLPSGREQLPGPGVSLFAGADVKCVGEFLMGRPCGGMLLREGLALGPLRGIELGALQSLFFAQSLLLEIFRIAPPLVAVGGLDAGVVIGPRSLVDGGIGNDARAFFAGLALGSCPFAGGLALGPSWICGSRSMPWSFKLLGSMRTDSPALSSARLEASAQPTRKSQVVARGGTRHPLFWASSISFLLVVVPMTRGRFFSATPSCE